MLKTKREGLSRLTEAFCYRGAEEKTRNSSDYGVVTKV